MALTVVIERNDTFLHEVFPVVAVGHGLGVKGFAGGGVVEHLPKSWLSEPDVGARPQIGARHDGVVKTSGRLEG